MERETELLLLGSNAGPLSPSDPSHLSLPLEKWIPEGSTVVTAPLIQEKILG